QPQIVPTVDQRDERADSADTLVDRPQDEDVSTAVRDAPGCDPLRIDIGQAFQVRERVPIVLDLPPGVDVLPWLAGTSAERGVVEEEGRETRLAEDACEVRLGQLLDVAPPSRHHNAWVRAFSRREIEQSLELLARACEAYSRRRRGLVRQRAP